MDLPEHVKIDRVDASDIDNNNKESTNKGSIESTRIMYSKEEAENLDNERLNKSKVSIDSTTQRVKDCILEPLSFSPAPQNAATEFAGLQECAGTNNETVDCGNFNSMFLHGTTPCMLCDNTYENVEKKEQHDEYLCHLIVEHKLVIADVKLIANLRSYALYWKKRFLTKPVKEFCSSIKTNTSPKDVNESEEYFLLCDALPEDHKVREQLQLNRLKELLAHQSKERDREDFERMCLFCTKFFIGNSVHLFNHMNEDHNFNVGHPHNLINLEEFLDEIEKKLNSLECLFCEKVFKDRASLREHMRKKSHRRLNPKNKFYDKYYIINYLEFGKNWETLQGEPEQFEHSDDWSGWDEDGQNAVCFFCSASFSAHTDIYAHMKDEHDFDFPQMRKDMNLSFYQQVKMINYIRRYVHQYKAVRKAGDEEVKNNSDPEAANALAEKIKDSIVNSTKWNQPQYYFPTYENDTLLCQLEDKEGLFEPEDTFIIGEDGIDCRAIINESVLTDLVVSGYFD